MSRAAALPWVELEDGARACGGGGKLDSASGERPYGALASSYGNDPWFWCIEIGTDDDGGIATRGVREDEYSEVG